MTIYNFPRLDAAESAFVARELEQIRSKTYDIKYPMLKARSLLPVDMSISPGAEYVTYKQYDQVGMAKIISNYADDLPRADVLVKEFSNKIRGVGSSYGYSLQEVRAAQFAGLPLEQRKANAARRACEEKLDKIAQSGDVTSGLLGILNQPNAITFVIVVGLWSAKTSDQIATDMHAIVSNMLTTTKEVETPDTMLIPLAQYGLISTKRMADGSDSTVLDFFLKTSPYIKNVIPWHACAGAGVGGADRMVIYRKDPDALNLVVPQDFEQLPPEQRGLEFITACHLRTGGVIVHYPLSISYADGI